MLNRSCLVRLVASLATLCAFVSTVDTYSQESIELRLPKLEEGSSSAASTSEVDQELLELEEAANPLTLKGIDLYITGDVDGAYALFKEVYDANPDSDPPGVLIALLHSHAGRFLEMRRSLEATARDYPSDPEAFFQLANIDVQEGRFLETELLVERGEALAEGYAALHPTSTTRVEYFREEGLTIRATLAEKRGNISGAEALMRKVVELNPSNAQGWWNLGYLAMKGEKYDSAEESFDEAAKLNPSLWGGWLQVLSMLDRNDLIEEAKLRASTKSDKISTATKGERSQLARLYLRWFMIEEAFAIVKEFEEANEERDIERWILSGWLGLYANRYAAAEEFFRNATLIDPTNFEATNGLALALLDQNNKEKISQARVIAARNYRANLDSQEAATTYGWCLFLSGNVHEADAIFQPMLETGKLTATAAYYLAEIAHARGELDLALDLVELALTQKGNYPKRVGTLELKEIIEQKLRGDSEGSESAGSTDFDEPDFEEVEPEEF